ncbi:hypothetical protein BDZ89DRAFT_1130723 [Hymenopellis radicata]|nr:hypothetical protein BDZ89DRAFT_1130723 [Hymenopellis radicata]
MDPPVLSKTVAESDFYSAAVSKKLLVPKHGNSLIVQLVLKLAVDSERSHCVSSLSFEYIP